MNPPYDELLRRMKLYRDNAQSVYPVPGSNTEQDVTAQVIVRLHGGTEETLASFVSYYEAYLVADLINELLKLREPSIGRLRQ
jgi:hypothetical protein